MASSSATGRRSPPYERPNMRDLRIVLLGKSVSENSRVGNIILGTAAFHSEASSYSQQHSVRISGEVEKRHISVINTHLLQRHLSHHQITQGVRECVSQCLSQQKRIRDELEEKLSERENEIKELEEKMKTLVPEGEKLNLVVCGSDRRLKSFISNLILNQSDRGSELSSECVRRDVDLHGRLISLVELPALFNTQISEEEVMRQTLRCVSLCDPGVHVFLLIIPDTPLNNEDRAEMEKIQKIFSSRINKHIMILMYQNPDHQTEELNEETQSVIERFGGRHHSIGPNTQASELMEKLKQMVEENSGVCFSTETLMEAQMEKLQTLEEMKRRIHSSEMVFQSKDSREKADDLRIVLLGKTGVGKSSTGNTILGRETFTAESSYESVTKKCTSESAEIHGRHITVIDTPGLFDTEVSNEEIQREITNSISMILPGPHVLFTRGDDLKNKTIDQWFGKPGSMMRNLIEACGNRFHVFNNNQTEDRTQVSDLLKKIDDMVKENGDSYYSCKMFREMEQEIQEKQMMIQTENVEELKREKEELMNKHKEEKKKMKMKLEEERQNHDKERKRREEEFREREERYKRDIKDIEEQERKIWDELKKEREEWQRQKQQERQREETRSFNLHMGLPKGQLANNNEDSGCLRILLCGRTGDGKSAIGNTILGKHKFHSEDHKRLVTTICKNRFVEVDGKSVSVVDTPGLFDTTLSKEQVQEEMMKCVSLSAPGPHVFIIVLRVRRINQEDRNTLEMIKKIFGPNAAEFSIVLFTRADDLKKQTIKQYVEKSDNDELNVMIRECGNRYLAFNNKETQDRAQVTELLNMIEKLKKSNEGRYFSNEMFEEAAVSIEKRRNKLEENKTKNLAKVEELKARYDMEDQIMRKRLEEKKQKTDEERVTLEKKFRETEEILRREFEKKEKSEKKKLEEEHQKQSEEEKQRRDEHDQRMDEMERKILQYEKQQDEREKEDRKREEKYRQDQEKMNDEQENMIELKEEKKRDSEEQMRKEQEEKEREEWKRKIKEAENDKEIQERIKQQQREWEEEKNRQMRERQEEEREMKERHKEKLREILEELEKMREKFEQQQEEFRQMIEKKREKQKRETEVKEEWERRKQEDEERRREWRKRWKKMMEDLKKDQEEEMKRREREEREIIRRDKKECDEVKQKHEDEIKEMKKKHQDEARKQEEQLNDFKLRKDQLVQEFKKTLEQLYAEKKKQEKLCHVM